LDIVSVTPPALSSELKVHTCFPLLLELADLEHVGKLVVQVGHGIFVSIDLLLGLVVVILILLRPLFLVPVFAILVDFIVVSC